MRLRGPAGTIARAYAAAGVRLDQPWRSAGYCAVDLETTGLDLDHDTIVSIGAVRVDGGRVIAGSSIYHLVGGAARASPQAIAVHTLRPADLADAPPLRDSIDDLLESLTGRVLVAHAAWIERAFLRRAFRLRRVSPPRVVVDTAALARAAGLADPGAAAEPSLEALAGALGLPPHAPHHALGDALTTAEVFLALTARLDASSPQTVRSLVAATAEFRLRLAITGRAESAASGGSRIPWQRRVPPTRRCHGRQGART
jgi:DNA polymerase III subunit epsilon